MGVKDETLSLFGFGLDSFIETISASGVLFMIYRIRNKKDEERSAFEITTLKITGWCFYALVIILAFSAIWNIYYGYKPHTTFWNIIVASISIVFMLIIVSLKKKIGSLLNSDPIIADANCGMVCVYMSIVLLVSGILFEIFHIAWFDILGTAGLIWFSVKEGREAFDKAKGKACCECC